MSGNFFLDNDDLRFQFDQLAWDKLVELVDRPFANEERFASGDDAKETFRELLTQMGAYIADHIAPHSKELDEQHPVLEANGEVTDPPRMKSIMAGLREMGAFLIAQPRRFGGMNAPLVVNNMFMELLARGDVAVMSHYGFHSGIGQALQLYSIEEGSTTIDANGKIESRYEAQIEKMATGEEWGAMVLTEPGAGSDLAQIKTRAVEKDGAWRITGQKIWITSGHGEHHIVIARSEPEETHPGLKGLSLFYCPAHVEKNGKRVRNFAVGGVEHKMGQHSAVAATIFYDDSEARLLGQRGHGFLGMLLLMNNARIAVGFESLGLMEHAYRRAKAFADERKTMGKPIARHEMIADYLDEMDVLIHGLRAITFEAAFHEECSTRLKTYLKTNPPGDDDARRAQEKEARRHQRRARHLTPLIKYIGGEEAVRCARMAMQIHGGMGYIVETGVEKLLRDALVVPVYEGTSQIQSLMALKDNLQAAIRAPGRFFSDLAAAKLDALRARDPLDRGVAQLKAHATNAMQTILTTIAAKKIGGLRKQPFSAWTSFFSTWDVEKDFSFGLLNAERLTKILAWHAMAERLVAQAHDTEGTPHAAWRRDVALRFIERFEVRARGVLLEIEESGTILRRLSSTGPAVDSDAA